jgi:hypothetical protein
MGLPNFIQATRRSISIPLSSGPDETAAGGGPPPRILKFAIQRQKQLQWCWAAVSVSVAHAYNPATPWRQCALVNAELGKTTCCAHGSSLECNKPNVLDHPLSLVGHLNALIPATVDAMSVTDEIDRDRPVACRIGWKGGGGHFIVLYGYDASGLIHVADPWGAKTSTYAFGSFMKGYHMGCWTHTYTTQP